MGIRGYLDKLMRWLAATDGEAEPAPRHERREAAHERHRAGGPGWNEHDRLPNGPEGMPISEAGYVDPVVFGAAPDGRNGPA